METTSNFLDLGFIYKLQTKIRSKYEQKVAQSYDTCLEAEKNLLEMNGVKIGKDYEISNVDIERDNQYLHRYRSLNENQGKQKLILLHGYGMNGLAYMKMLKPLMQKYEVHCLDLPGMGLSSRDDFSQINEEKETIDYFVSSLEAYRRVNNIDKFTLAGHSFGGFMGANYAMQHPQHVDNLVLLSPLGSTYRSTQEIEQQYTDMLNRSNFVTRPLLTYYLSLFKNKVTLQQANQKWYIPLKTLLSRYLNSALNLKENEKEPYNKFVFSMLNLPESSDKALYNVIKDTSVFVKTPLEHSLPERMSKNIPVHFLFGDSDWMDYGGAYKLYRLQQQNGLKIKFNILTKTRHQVTMDNPDFIVNYLLTL